MGVLLAAAPVEARVFRARFDPETLELQKPGNLELNVMTGGLYGDGVDGSRYILPDLEVDLGVLSWLEVSIDGAFSLTNLGTSDVGLGGDPLWTSARFELLNLKQDNQEHTTFGMGLQVGPRFRTIDNARGVGLGALLLAGGGTKELRVVGNLGTFLDRDQAGALVYGAAVEYDLELRRKWTLQGQFAGAHYYGDTQGDTDPNQAFLLAGFGTEVTETLQLSLLGLLGFAKGDRLGLMASVTWDHQLW
ncbi:MAG TPA: hypothetical protein VFX59_14355 [Polyangiales bacterium]|nr:hypothetical protein [Polyangiales bacterium]